MLFRTVYGPELEAIYCYIDKYGPLSRSQVITVFTGIDANEKASTANIEDAIAFLKTAGMIKTRADLYHTIYKNVDSIDFKLCLLKQISSLKKSHSKLDTYYFQFLDLLFVKQDKVFQNELHKAVNSLDLPWPCSEEKINAWRRVLEYLGLGYRGYSGLAVHYDCEIVKRIIARWDEKEGPLQHFLEKVFSQYLPWATYDGDISSALRLPLLRLVEQGAISLQPKQDLPYKSYLGQKRVKWLSREDA